MSFSSIDLCSKALNKIGADAIVSFDEGTPEAEIAGSLYDILKYKLLSSFPWGFATVTIKLNKIVSDINTEFSCVYALPSDFLRAISISSGLKYKIVGSNLVSNDEDVSLTYIADVKEEYFPPIFISAFIFALAAELSLSLLNDTTKYNLFSKLFLNEIKEAKSVDSSQDSLESIKSFPFIDIRK